VYVRECDTCQRKKAEMVHQEGSVFDVATLEANQCFWRGAS